MKVSKEKELWEQKLLQDLQLYVKIVCCGNKIANWFKIESFYSSIKILLFQNTRIEQWNAKITWNIGLKDLIKI